MSQDEHRERLAETRNLARSKGIDLREAPLLVCFDVPILRSCIGDHGILALARMPGVAVGAICPHALPAARGEMVQGSRLHVVAERGLVCGLSGGAVVHVYPNLREEFVAFAVALFASTAPDGLPFALAGYVSPGRQEVAFGAARSGLRSPGGHELLRALRSRDVFAQAAGEEAIVVDDAPPALDAVREVLSHDLAHIPVAAHRLPSGRFRFTTAVPRRPVEPDRLRAVAQAIALSSDRVWEQLGETGFAFATEAVAQGRYGVEQGVRRLAEEVFGTPHTAIAFYGPESLTGDGILNFGPAIKVVHDFEQPEEKENGPPKVEVDDVFEFVRILQTIREGG